MSSIIEPLTAEEFESLKRRGVFTIRRDISQQLALKMKARQSQIRSQLRKLNGENKACEPTPSA